MTKPAMASQFDGNGMSAWGLMSRNSVSPSTRTEVISTAAGAATTSVRLPTPSVTETDSGWVEKLPGAKSRASRAMVVVSLPSGLATVAGADCDWMRKSPQAESSSGAITTYPAGCVISSIIGIGSPTVRFWFSTTRFASTGPSAKAGIAIAISAIRARIRMVNCFLVIASDFQGRKDQ